jgi:hypothetical protein
MSGIKEAVAKVNEIEAALPRFEPELAALAEAAARARRERDAAELLLSNERAKVAEVTARATLGIEGGSDSSHAATIAALEGRLAEANGELAKAEADLATLQEEHRTVARGLGPAKQAVMGAVTHVFGERLADAYRAFQSELGVMEDLLAAKLATERALGLGFDSGEGGRNPTWRGVAQVNGRWEGRWRLGEGDARRGAALVEATLAEAVGTRKARAA